MANNMNAQQNATLASLVSLFQSVRNIKVSPVVDTDTANYASKYAVSTGFAFRDGELMVAPLVPNGLPISLLSNGYIRIPAKKSYREDGGNRAMDAKSTNKNGKDAATVRDVALWQDTFTAGRVTPTGYLAAPAPVVNTVLEQSKSLGE